MTFLNEEIKEAATILSRAEISRTSTRNAFFKRAQEENEKYTDRKFYNTVYHLVMETIRRKNKLDAFLSLVLRDELLSLNAFQIALLQVLVYIRKEQEYRTKKRPSLNHLLIVTKKIFAEKIDENALSSLISSLEHLDLIDERTVFKARSEIEQLSLEYFHPIWLIKMLQGFIGRKSTIKLLETNNKRHPAWLRVVDHSSDINNTERAIEALAKEKITAIADLDFEDVLLVTEAKKPVVLTSLFKSGQVVIQSKASSAVTHILQPFPNSIVIDLAAAPGMKSLHIWEKMKREGTLALLEISSKRARTLRHRIDEYSSNDDFAPFVFLTDSQTPPLRSNVADRVLVDAPCSSSGIIGMYPDHKWRSASLGEELAPTQLSMLNSALELLKKGGIGVYSVCSLNPKEGEFVINEFLQRNENVELMNPGFGRSSYDVEIRELELCRRVFPHTDGTDGFFYCKFRKKAK
ncbi:MAG: RsmB/NOP family class I SAM-dependent RNA methyltransferase [Candidatus Hodarchaeales archaeon]|jgi:16S rRNA (cytosine967-C5)-methyltransferase